MTPEEAIKEQERASGEGWFARRPELAAAVKLGIEALRRHKAQQCCLVNVIVGPLPGETEE